MSGLSSLSSSLSPSLKLELLSLSLSASWRRRLRAVCKLRTDHPLGCWWRRRSWIPCANSHQLSVVCCRRAGPAVSAGSPPDRSSHHAGHSTTAEKSPSSCGSSSHIAFPRSSHQTNGLKKNDARWCKSWGNILPPLLYLNVADANGRGGAHITHCLLS